MSKTKEYAAIFSTGQKKTRRSAARVYTHAYALLNEGRVVHHGFATSADKACRHARGDNVRYFEDSAFEEIVPTVVS